MVGSEHIDHLPKVGMQRAVRILAPAGIAGARLVLAPDWKPIR
jgi:hypothetical protein